MKRHELLNIIESVVDEVMDEVSTSVGAGPYDTPMAFSKKTLRPKKKKKSVPVSEATYKDFRNDATRNNNRKIGECIKRVNALLHEADRLLTHSIKLKKEYGVASESLWKDTQRRSTALEQRAMGIITKLRNMRS